MIGLRLRALNLAGLFALLAPGYAGISLGDSAQVLPKGRSGILMTYYDYSKIDERYDSDGDQEDLAEDFNTSLDSSVFADLEAVEIGFSLPAGSASLGDTDVDLEYDIKIFEFEYYYGITDKFTAGIKIPYWWVETKVKASVNSGAGSSATVGFNPLFGTGGDPFGSPIIPIGLGGQPATDEDIQNILGPGVDINGVEAVPGFGYDEFETWKDEGLSDVEFSGRYQYEKNEKWRHAFTAGFRVPTGETDDPDNLADLAFGLGAYQILLRSNHDVAVSDKLTLNLTFKYDIVLSDKQTKRVPTDVNQPITSNKVRVDIDYGDVFELDTTATYRFTPQWSTFGRLRFTYQDSNDVDGPSGVNVDSLEAETRREGHQYQVGVAYSTVSRYLDGNAKVPFRAALSYRDRYAGENLLDSQYLKFEGQLFF
jgi:hypothetical protein